MGVSSFSRCCVDIVFVRFVVHIAFGSRTNTSAIMSNKSNVHGGNKAKGFGLTAELEKKKAGKFDADMANAVFEWMIIVLKIKDEADADIKTLEKEVTSMDDVAKALKDGRILCKVVNVIRPGTVKKINKIDNPNSPFKISKESENISNFLTGCGLCGCVVGDLFQTVDLYEANNIPSVIDGIASLGRKVEEGNPQGVPHFGPKEAEKNEREFSDEVIAAGKMDIGLQMGTNKCASQAGQNFGKTRAIID